MDFLFFARKALLIVLGLVLVGCAKEDGSRILGKWRAERFEVFSLKLPVGPELAITQDELSTASNVSIPINAIMQDGEEVTLETDSLIGMTFHFVEPDRMYFELPIIGRIYYQRVNGPAVAAAVVAAPEGAAAAAPVAVASGQPARLVEPTVAPQSAPPANLEQAYAEDYAQALALARQGDSAGAVRSLFDAFTHGFRDVSLLNKTPEFDSLKTDIRYQALLARYAGQ
jgi:hypothetical protein